MAETAKTYQIGTLTYTKGALAVLFLWLLWGDFCFILMESVVPSLVPLKFMKLGASNTLMGTFIISVPAVIGLVCNPVISVKSDRHRGRFGRRIPFILVTMPFLSACLIALGYVDQLGGWLAKQGTAEALWSWLQRLLPGHVTGFSPLIAVLIVLCLFLTLFNFFNMFVNSVFWYLFNDVVPEQLLARFISWFRVVTIASAGLYNLLIFEHANTHYTEIFVGAGVLYFIGFGLMCLRVKEGHYPPPPPLAAGNAVVESVKTYFRECLSLKHYWFLFLASMGLVLAVMSMQFEVQYQTTLGLSLEQIGRLKFTMSLTQVVVIPLTGWLADRFHPLRVVICGLLLQLLVAPLTMIWVFWKPSPDVIFYVQIGIMILLTAPVGCLIAMMDPPLLMRIFPRERYGQFCSANAMLRYFALIGGGFLFGKYLDILDGHFGIRAAYCSMGLWNLAAYGLVLLALLGLYRSWQKQGGDKNYHPPLPKGSKG